MMSCVIVAVAENNNRTLIVSFLTPNSQTNPFVELFMLEEANKLLNKQTNYNLL